MALDNLSKSAFATLQPFRGQELQGCSVSFAYFIEHTVKGLGRSCDIRYDSVFIFAPRLFFLLYVKTLVIVI